MEKPTVVPLFMTWFDKRAEKIICMSKGFKLSEKKYIRRFNYSEYAEMWGDVLDTTTPVYRQELKDVKFAIYTYDDQTPASAQTVLLFIKMIKDSQALIEFAFVPSNTNEAYGVSEIDSIDLMAGEAATLNDDSVTYTLEDLREVGIMARSYFDFVVLEMFNNQNEKPYFPIFNAVNYTRVATSDLFQDIRLKLPLFSIAMESLFIYENYKASEQFSKNIVFFMKSQDGLDLNELKSKCELFYAARSDLIHGDVPKEIYGREKELHQFALSILLRVLKSCLTDKNVIGNFRNRDGKKMFFKNQTTAN